MGFEKKTLPSLERYVCPRQRKEAEDFLSALSGGPPGKEPTGGTTIAGTFRFRYFRAVWTFCAHEADVADGKGDRPWFLARWNRVPLDLSFRAAGGLSEEDQVRAARIGELRPPR